jgi:hypothetical protein
MLRAHPPQLVEQGSTSQKAVTAMTRNFQSFDKKVGIVTGFSCVTAPTKIWWVKDPA